MLKDKKSVSPKKKYRVVRQVTEIFKTNWE